MSLAVFDILIGEIVSAHGIKGEVKVKSYSESLDHFKSFGTISVGDELYEIESSKTSGNMVLLKLRGIDDRNAAEELIKKSLYISQEQLSDLPEDTYYVRDLIGLKVLNALDDSEIGEIKDVLQTGPQDIYVIKLPDSKEAMIPAVKEFIQSVSIADGFIKIRFIEGMLPE